MTDLTARELPQLQVEVLFTHDMNGTFCGSTNRVGAPRFFRGRTTEGIPGGFGPDWNHPSELG